jgi:hypothetical protein
VHNCLPGLIGAGSETEAVLKATSAHSDHVSLPRGLLALELVARQLSHTCSAHFATNKQCNEDTRGEHTRTYKPVKVPVFMIHHYS